MPTQGAHLRQAVGHEGCMLNKFMDCGALSRQARGAALLAATLDVAAEASALTCCPEVTSQSATSPSSPPVMTCWPSANLATCTGALCPLNCRSSVLLLESNTCEQFCVAGL